MSELKDRVEKIIEKDVKNLLPYLCVDVGITGWNMCPKDREFHAKAKIALERAFLNSSLLKSFKDQQARLIELEAACKLAAETFRKYESLHAAKPDIEKAKRNAELAEIMEKALAV